MSDAPLSPDESRALAHVLDTIIPPSADGRLPGAGAAGLADRLDSEVSELRPLVRQGLAALDTLARKRGADGFGALSGAARSDTLNVHAAQDPGLLPGLIFQTYVRYYQLPAVLEVLGLEARPPHPLGYPLEDGDLGALEAVRQRGPIYRDV